MTNEDKTVIAEIGSLAYESPTRKKSMACLVQYNGAAMGKRYALDRPRITIGRSGDAELSISEASVSRLHARLTSNPDESVNIEDVGSANGTFVNDLKIAGTQTLQDQDVIRLGAVLLKFFASDNLDGIVQDKIYRMATIDVGTQIFNRQYVMEALSSEFKLSSATGRPLSLFYYDLDHFKKVNDTYGHAAGDQVLKELSNIVKATVRKDDILGRVGGEEFMIVLPQTDAVTALELGERIRKACQNHTIRLELMQGQQKSWINHTQTLSAGIAQLVVGIKTAEELLVRADRKLYESKQNGRNRISV